MLGINTEKENGKKHGNRKTVKKKGEKRKKLALKRAKVRKLRIGKKVCQRVKHELLNAQKINKRGSKPKSRRPPQQLM